MHKPGQKQNSASHLEGQICNSANLPCKPKVCSSGGQCPVLVSSTALKMCWRVGPYTLLSVVVTGRVSGLRLAIQMSLGT